MITTNHTNHTKSHEEIPKNGSKDLMNARLQPRVAQLAHVPKENLGHLRDLRLKARA